jgi:uncharacterized membrane protein YhaH (DUF805 family)
MKEPYNPYAPPQTTVADIVSEDKIFQRVKIFSAAGRMGRMRLLAYSFCSWISIFILLFLFAFFLAIFTTSQNTISFVGENIRIILLILVVPILILNLFWCIQRCHDMNWSGWFSILGLLIPILWIYWAVKSGTVGSNRFGPPPEPNNLGVNILGGLSILLGSIYFIRLLPFIIRSLA